MVLPTTLNREDHFILGSMMATFAGTGLASVFVAPSLFGISALLVFGFLLVATIGMRSERLAWLLVYGCVTGVVELWADWLHVVHLRTLVYTDYFGFQVLASPSYMPVGWCIVVAQFGYLALRLNDFWPRWLAVSLVTAAGMLLAPWFEELAARAQAWHYTTSGPMLSHTPVWVILAYGGCMFAIAAMAITYYRTRDWSGALVAGMFTGAGLMLSGVFWFAVVG